MKRGTGGIPAGYWEHRYVSEALDWPFEPVDNDHLRCPHLTWSVYERQPFCRPCIEPRLARLVSEGARDDEILPALRAVSIPDRRWVETTLGRLRGVPSSTDGPSGPFWARFVEVYASKQTEPTDEPPQVTVAEGFRRSEQWLRDRLREVGISDYRDVHWRIAADLERRSKGTET